MIDRFSVAPSPSDGEAIAIASAVGALLDEEAGSSTLADPRPDAYRSPWRAAALSEGVHRMTDNGWPQ